MGARMKRNDWDIRLAEFVDAARNKQFDWREWECLRFANEAVRVQTGEGFADDWTNGYDSAKSAKKLYIEKQKSEPHDDIIGAVDARMKRRAGRMPFRGDIVARIDANMPVLGVSFGVCVSDLVAFVSESGIKFDRPAKTDVYWCVE